MATFELVRYGEAPRELAQGVPYPCRAIATGDLHAAIDKARELSQHDPLNVVEVRQDGQLVCTVGYGWMSRRCGAANA